MYLPLISGGFTGRKMNNKICMDTVRTYAYGLPYTLYQSNIPSY